MTTPLQEFYEYMEQQQYFIGNDLYKKYHELLEKEKKSEVIDKVDQLQPWQKEILQKLESESSLIELCNRDNTERGIERD